MVMEFYDDVMDVDKQVISSSHWKQFTEVGTLGLLPALLHAFLALV